MEVYFEGTKIYFRDKEENIFGYTNYDEALWQDIKSVNWTVIWGKPNSKGDRKGYIGTYSKKLGYDKLHQIVMQHWYGGESIKEAYKKNFVIDHMDNNSFDCTIKNLSFAPNNVNVAKGQVYDVERAEAIPQIAINMYKDFKTGKYQITVGFNTWVAKKTKQGLVPMNSIFLVYENDYRRTLKDAEEILYEFTTTGTINLQKLHHIHIEEVPAIIYTFNEGNKKSGQIEIDGKAYLILDENSQLVKVAPKKELYEK